MFEPEKVIQPGPPDRGEGHEARSRAMGDLYGGLTSAIIGLPLAIAFGAAAFAPLGPEHAGRGALVGLLGAVFTGFFAALFGGTPVQITGPTAPMTVVLTAFLAEVATRHGAAHLPTVIVLMALAIIVGGVAQILLGAAGGGKIVKYIPYPVVAGFMNGIAVLIFLGQIKPFLGVSAAFGDLTLEAAWVPATVGTVTIAALLVTRRATKRVPASLVGLLAGVLAYLIIAALGQAPLHAEANPLLLGPIPSPLTGTARLADLVPLLNLGALGEMEAVDLRSVATAGLALGVLGSIDSLLTSVVADSVTHSRHDSRKELIGQGIGNLVAGALGGLAGAGATVRTLVNVEAGGRTSRAGMIHAGVIILVVVVLAVPASWIPMSALSGILFVTAVGMIDFYSLRLVRRRRVRHEFAIMVTVTLLTVAVDLMVAVAIGCGIAAVLFVWQQTRIEVIRRRLRGDELTSRRVRGDVELLVLSEHGRRTLAYELTGSLFFGTADALIAEVEQDLSSADRFIFDFAKVRDMDLSGVQILLTILERIRDQGAQVALSGLANVERSNPDLHGLLTEMGVLRHAGEGNVHDTLDLALEAFEETVLGLHRPRVSGAEPTAPMALTEYDVFEELSADEISRIAALAKERLLETGDVLFHEGDPADHLALIRDGRMEVMKQVEGGHTRLASLGRGSLWGAQVFFARSRWSSTLRAASPTRVFLLPGEAVAALAEEDPKTLADLQRELLRIHVDRIERLTSEWVLLEER